MTGLINEERYAALPEKCTIDRTSGRSIRAFLASGLFFFLGQNVALALTAQDCVGEGGAYLCSAPSPATWTYNICDNAGAYVYRYKAWCEAYGGTWYGLNAGCEGADYTKSESNLVALAEAFSNKLTGRTDCVVNSDTGWGEALSSNLCYSGSPQYQNGIVRFGIRYLNSSNCGEDFYAIRNRDIVCQAGSQSHSIDGKIVCIKEEEFSQCNAVGNPVLPLTGKKVEYAEDFSGALPLVRVYASSPAFVPYNVIGNLPDSVGQFGDYWRTNFSYKLFILNGNLSRYAITFPSGAVEYFSSDLVQTTQLYRSGFLRSEDGGFVYQLGDLELTFSTAGYLKYYEKMGQRRYALYYSGIDLPSPIPATLPDGRQSDSAVPNGLLMEIRSSGDQVIYKFSYDASGRVVFIERAPERLFYEYDLSGNLTKVNRSDSSNRQYIYGNAAFKHALTSIIDESGANFAEWSYDSSGRAVSSMHNGSEAVSLDFSQVSNTPDMRVSVTNPLGKKTTYHYGVFHGLRKVKSLEGHASTNCAAANKSYDYYPNGTLKSKTDWSGNITTYERDEFGREVSRTEASGTPEARTVMTEYHPTLNLPVRITEPDRVEVMTYDEVGRLLSKNIQPTAAPSP